MAEKIYHRLRDAFHRTRLMSRQGWAILRQNPQIGIYPYVAVLVIVITFPVANAIVYSLWSHFAHSTIFSAVDDTPHTLRIFLGLATFSVFYTGLVTSYFTCAVAADVLDRLEGKNVHSLHGLHTALKKFFKITKFGLLGLFFFPLGIIAQRKKHVSSFVWVIASSFTLHMPQLAPVIVSENMGLMESMRYTINKLSHVWAEGIIIRAFAIAAFIVVSLGGFLTKSIEGNWFGGSNSGHVIGWMVGVFIWVLGYVVIKVISTVLATSLYYHARTGK